MIQLPFQQVDDDKFTVLPRKVLKSKASLQSKVLYGIIMNLAKKKKYAFAGTDFYCEELQCTHPTFRAYLKDLEENKLVHIHRLKGDVSYIYPRYFVKTTKKQTYV